MILQYYLHLLSIKHSLLKKDYNNAIYIIESQEEMILKIEESIINKNILQNEMMIMTFAKIEVYILSQKANKALKVINNYLNYHNKALKTDTFIISRLLNVIIHFDLNNFDYIEYEIISIKKWLKGKNNSYKLERKISHAFGEFLDLIFVPNK